MNYQIINSLINKLDELGFAWITEQDLAEITKVEDNGIPGTIQTLTNIRKKAVLEKDENKKNKKFSERLQCISFERIFLCRDQRNCCLLIFSKGKVQRK